MKSPLKISLTILMTCISMTNTELLYRNPYYNSSQNQSTYSLSFFISLFLRENHTRNDEWSDCFLRSLLFFYPVKTEVQTSVLLVIDEEMKGTTSETKYVKNVVADLSKELIDEFPTIEVLYNPYLPNAYKKGYDRQQFLMFYADNYTTNEYVAFVDTDTYIHTVFSNDDLIIDGKPIIRGVIGVILKAQAWTNGYTRSIWSRSTYDFIGLEEPMACMTYFPVVFKVKHFKLIREYIANRWKTSFEQAFYDHYGDSSQFNIFCTLAWTLFKDEYTWHLQDISPWWDGFHPKPVYGQWSEKHIFNSSMLHVRPTIAEHLNRRHGHPISTVLEYTMKSYCWRPQNSSLYISPHSSMPNILTLLESERAYKMCQVEHKRGYFERGFEFEAYKMSNSYSREQLIEAFQLRYNRTRNTYHKYIWI